MNKKVLTENHEIHLKEENEDLIILVNNIGFAKIPSLSIDELNINLLIQFIDDEFDSWDAKTLLILDRFIYMLDGSTCANSRS